MLLPIFCNELTVTLVPSLTHGWQNKTQGVSDWSERLEMDGGCLKKQRDQGYTSIFKIWYKIGRIENTLKLLTKQTSLVTGKGHGEPNPRAHLNNPFR